MTSEEIEKLIERIIKATTPYEVLDIKKESNNRDIKRAYHKISRVIHPDKCKHEKATECFQKVSAAHILLNDNTKRQMYDSGDEEKWMYCKKAMHKGNIIKPAFTEGVIASMFGFEDDISPEEVFSAVFGDVKNVQNSFENRKFYSGKMKLEEEFNDDEKKSIKKSRFNQSLCFLIPIFLSFVWVMKTFY